jgi:hypothetical protein
MHKLDVQTRTPRKHANSASKLPDPAHFTDPTSQRGIHAPNNIFGHLLTPPHAHIQLHLATPPVSPPCAATTFASLPNDYRFGCMGNMPDETRSSRYYMPPGAEQSHGGSSRQKTLLPDADLFASRMFLPDPLGMSMSTIMAPAMQITHRNVSSVSTKPMEAHGNLSNSYCEQQQEGRFEDRVASLAGRLEKVLMRRSQVYLCVLLLLLLLCVCVYLRLYCVCVYIYIYIERERERELP